MRTASHFLTADANYYTRGCLFSGSPNVRLSLVKLVEPLYTEPYGGVIARITNAVGSSGSAIGAEQLTFIYGDVAVSYTHLTLPTNSLV